MALSDIFKRKKGKSAKGGFASGEKKAAPEKESTLKLKVGEDEKRAIPAKKKILKKKEVAPKVGDAKVKDEDSRDAYKVLLRPVVTEKAADLTTRGKYVFEVAPRTNKSEIKKAMQALYDVSPTRVRIMTNPGKVVRRGRITGKRKAWKKAIVTLSKGEKIEIYEGV